MNIRNCRMCGHIFNYVAGPILCPHCREKMEAKFQEVKEYIRANPGVGIQDVAENCDVEPSQIQQWLREERLELTEGSAIYLQCEKCGAKLLTASATVNGKDTSMTDGNAIVPLTVVNNPGFDLPKTGGYGVWMYTVGGVLLLGAAAFIVAKSRKHKNEQ